MHIKNKVKSKKGGTMLIVIICSLLIAAIVIIPSLINTSYSRIASKKLKNYAYNAANSAVIVAPEIKDTGSVIYHPDKGEQAMKSYFESLFGESFQRITKPIQNSQYYSAAYKNSSGTIAFQYIFYPKVLNLSMPTKDMINDIVLTSSDGSKFNDSKIINSAYINKPGATIILRYDSKTSDGDINSEVRIATSRDNYYDRYK